MSQRPVATTTPVKINFVDNIFTTFKKPSEYNIGQIFEVEFKNGLKELFIVTDSPLPVNLCKLQNGGMYNHKAAYFGDINASELINTTLKR